jgi:phenylalanyl-tRNA synthetase alpha chain
MEGELAKLREKAVREIASLRDVDALEQWRVAYLGKKGALSLFLRGLGNLQAAERPLIGQLANNLKTHLDAQFAAKMEELAEGERARVAELGKIDVTLPGHRPLQGQVHPVTRILEEILGAFAAMGFQVVEGPEVEWDHYNFEALNIPRDHPARDMWDTFYVQNQARPGEMLLRTHTSPNQIRVMEKSKPPVRVVVPGKCYRYEATDASHESMFYQVEGLAVDETITFADLKGTLTEFARSVFGKERRTRFRCEYFPFVEPGVEMSIDCFFCKGAGCSLCKHSGWIEILGAGMVHPKVLEGVGYDSRRYSGFAFGMGPERVAMLKYGIDDIRLFYANDLRFLRQFQ